MSLVIQHDIIMFVAPTSSTQSSSATFVEDQRTFQERIKKYKTSCKDLDLRRRGRPVSGNRIQLSHTYIHSVLLLRGKSVNVAC